eukprot:g74142.t1
MAGLVISKVCLQNSSCRRYGLTVQGDKLRKKREAEKKKRISRSDPQGTLLEPSRGPKVGTDKPHSQEQLSEQLHEKCEGSTALGCQQITRGQGIDPCDRQLVCNFITRWGDRSTPVASPWKDADGKPLIPTRYVRMKPIEPSDRTVREGRPDTPADAKDQFVNVTENSIAMFKHNCYGEEWRQCLMVDDDRNNRIMGLFHPDHPGLQASGQVDLPILSDIYHALAVTRDCLLSEVFDTYPEQYNRLVPILYVDRLEQPTLRYAHSDLEDLTTATDIQWPNV